MLPRSQANSRLQQRGRSPATHRRHSAFTLLETLITIGIIVLVFSMLIVAICRARASARSVTCLANLHQIAMGLRTYAMENHSTFPNPVAAGTSWESALNGYVTNTSVFLCPADNEIGPVTGSSYDWRDTGIANTTLAGRALTDCNRDDAVLAFDSLPGWHVKDAMNVARFDGSTLTLDTKTAINDLLTPIR